MFGIFTIKSRRRVPAHFCCRNATPSSIEVPPLRYFTSSNPSLPAPLTFRSHVTSMSLEQSQTFIASVTSVSIPFLISATPHHVADIACVCCIGAFDLTKKEPMLLLCGHSICSNCLISAKSAGLQEVMCNLCKLSTGLGQKLNCNHSLVDLLKTESFNGWYTSVVQDA